MEAALYDSALALLHPHAANFFLSDRPPVRTGNDHPNIAPYSLYRTGTRPIFLAVGNDRQFARLCEMIGVSALSNDPRFAANGARVENRDALRAELETALARHDGPPLAERLIAAGVPCGAVLATDEALAHPHVAHREMIVTMGSYKGMGAPVKLAATPASYRRPPPAFGADTEAVLAALGYGVGEVEELKASGVVPAKAP